MKTIYKYLLSSWLIFLQNIKVVFDGIVLVYVLTHHNVAEKNLITWCCITALYPKINVIY